MQREQIVNRLQQLAALRGGHIGFREFLKEIGYSEQWLRGQLWFTGWNNLLSELGLHTRKFEPPRRESSEVVKAIVEIVEQHGGWPTDDEFRRARATNPVVPSVAYAKKLRRSGELARLIAPFAVANPSNQTLAELASETPSAIDTGAQSKIRVQGYVYMLRAGKLFKIGRETTEGARQAAAGTWLEDPKVIHRIATDDPVGIEKYWHERFKTQGKHVKKELFNLTAADVAAFKAWKRIV